MRHFLAILLAAGLAAPALAQDIDFGDDSGAYSNDGECDDPRFEGPGMTNTPLLDDDIRADATDCRAAYERGELTLKEGGGTSGDGKRTVAAPLPDGPWDFGDDSSEYANDGECDDRRFYGPGMSSTFNWEHTGRDATDCRTAFEREQISRWIYADALAATQCSAIDFGDDSGDYAKDGECDDPRFEGRAVDGILTDSDKGRDATDCSRACAFGLIALRDYSTVSEASPTPGKGSAGKTAQPDISSD